MITREMKLYEWERPTLEDDSYGQAVSTTTPLGMVEAAIYFDAQVSVNNPQFIEATHIGLTQEKHIANDDLLDSFVVLQVNPIGRFNQLILKKV